MADPGSHHRLAAIVPAWNEAAAIGAVVRGLRRAGACCVFVVDPGSTDGTREVARAAGAVVVGEARKGYGRACLSGARAARGHELLAFLDGDGSCDPVELTRLGAAAGQADLVLGRRVSVVRAALPWHAGLGNRLVAAALRARSGRPVHDLPPFKVIRADALAVLALQDEGYGWTAELVGRVLTHPALRAVEVPASFHPRTGGVSKVSGRLGPSLRAARAMLGQAWTATRRRGSLVLMAKAPRSGHSKTRLETELGSGAAAGFWSACLSDSAAHLAAAAHGAGVNALAMTPTEADARVVRALTGLPCVAQRRPGLGEALLQVSDLPGPFAIAVSADTPTLPQERLVEALAAVRAGHAVLGPGPDGGYYLVGLPRDFDIARRRRAFLEVSPGEGDVFERTRAALGGVHVLEPWPDVDTAAELEAVAAELGADPGRAPAVADWLSRVRQKVH